MAEPEVELGALTQLALSAFRDDHGTLRAGHLTHAVAVTDGTIEVTPFHVAETRVQGGKLALQTGSITTSDGTSLGGPHHQRLAGGIVEITRGNVVETVTNRADGVEQAWRFADRPRSQGDLVVAVAPIGQQYIAATANGLHFQSKQGLGFRYSNAVWVEATGARWPIEARFDGGQIVMTVPEEIVANTTFPAVLDPTITAEIAVDAPVNGGTGVQSTQPAIAFDGTNYLVVWNDRRIDADGDIFGTRISPTGAVLDALGITIAATPGVQSRPAVAFVGGNYVVVWEDFLVAGGAQANIGAAAVSTAGIVTALASPGATAASETEPSIGSSGGVAVAAWTAGTDIAAARSTGGAFTPVALPAGGTPRVTTAVAGNTVSGELLVAWSEGATATADLRGSIVSAAGTAGALFDISAGAGRQFDPAATFDGANYMLAWTNNNAGINLFGAGVSPAGVVLNTHLEGAVTVGGVSVSSAALNQDQGTISCLASGCVIAWRDSRNLATSSFDILAQRVNPDFTPAGAEFALTNVNQQQALAALSNDGSGHFGTWQDERDARNPAIFGSTVSATGAVGAPGLLVTGNNREFNAASGRVGIMSFVAWADSRSADSTDIEFVRFSGTTKLDATARAASTAANSQVAPVVSSSGAGSAYVVWSDTRNGADFDIFGTKLNTDGSVTNAGGIAVGVAAGDQLVPFVSSNPNGTAAFAVWQDRRNGNFDIIGALLDANGNVVTGDIVVCNAAGDQTRPSVAFDTINQQWLVVWADARVATNTDVFAARVSSAGAVLDTNGVNISNANLGQFSAVVAFTNGGYLAAWEDRRNDSQGDIIGTRLTGGGSITVLDPAGLAIGATAGAQSAPTVADNAGSFVVAWQDGRNVATTKSDIFGIGIGTNGLVSEPEFVVSAGPDDESGPVVNNTVAGSSGIRIAYQRQRLDLQTLRIVSRQITTIKTTGNLCSNDANCGVGGFCVDGYCCDTACGGNDKTDCQACRAALTSAPNGVCAPVRSGIICRDYADTFCDIRETCNGTAITCPDDLGRRENVTCAIAGGGIGACPANDLTGAPHVCQ